MKHLSILAALALMVSGGPAANLNGQEKSKVDYSKSGHEYVFVPDDVDLLEEKILPLDAAPMEICEAGKKIILLPAGQKTPRKQKAA